MQEQKARKILQALVQGVDPGTGAELNGDTVMQQAEVLRALLAGIDALGQTSARAQRRAALPLKVGQPWAADEERELVSGFRSGLALIDIAARHGRTPRAIEARLERLGLLVTDRRPGSSALMATPAENAIDSAPP